MVAPFQSAIVALLVLAGIQACKPGSIPEAPEQADEQATVVPETCDSIFNQEYATEAALRLLSATHFRRQDACYASLTSDSTVVEYECGKILLLLQQAASPLDAQRLASSVAGELIQFTRGRCWSQVVLGVEPGAEVQALRMLEQEDIVMSFSLNFIAPVEAS